MARPRDPRRDEAKRIWMLSVKEKRNLKLIDLVKQLEVTSNTVRKWKATDRWMKYSSIQHACSMSTKERRAWSKMISSVFSGLLEHLLLESTICVMRKLLKSNKNFKKLDADIVIKLTIWNMMF